MSAAPNGKSVWVAAASVGGLILAIVGAVGGALGTGYMRDQERIEANLALLNERALRNAQTIGEQTERLTRVDALVRDLDVSLQREMRTLDAAMEVRIVDQDRRLQSEISRSAAERHEQIQAIRNATMRFEDQSEARFLRLERAAKSP